MFNIQGSSTPTGHQARVYGTEIRMGTTSDIDLAKRYGLGTVRWEAGVWLIRRALSKVGALQTVVGLESRLFNVGYGRAKRSQKNATELGCMSPLS